MPEKIVTYYYASWCPHCDVENHPQEIKRILDKFGYECRLQSIDTGKMTVQELKTLGVDIVPSVMIEGKLILWNTESHEQELEVFFLLA